MFKRLIKFSLLSFLVFSWIACAHGESTKGGPAKGNGPIVKREASEKLFANVNPSSWIAETFKVSPDSRRVAYGVKVGDKSFVVIDGQEGKQYDGIAAGSLIFSLDSRRVAYGASVGNKWLVVVDSQEGKQYDGIAEGSLIFSPDSHRVAYSARIGNKGFVVVDSQECTQYDGILKGGGPIFDSPDRLHYLAGIGNQIFLVEEQLK